MMMLTAFFFSLKENLRWWIITRDDTRYAITLAMMRWGGSRGGSGGSVEPPKLK